MYSGSGYSSDYAKKLTKDWPLAQFLTTPAKQAEPLYMLFNCGI